MFKWARRFRLYELNDTKMYHEVLDEWQEEVVDKYIDKLAVTFRNFLKEIENVHTGAVNAKDPELDTEVDNLYIRMMLGSILHIFDYEAHEGVLLDVKNMADQFIENIKHLEQYK